MKKNLFGCLLLLCTAFVFASCSDNSEEPTPPSVAVTGIKLNKTMTSVKIGETLTLTHTVLPENADNKDVTWSSSDEQKATVKDGVVTTLSHGKVIITVKTVDGEKTAKCDITIPNPNVAVISVSVSKSPITLKVGTKETINAIISPETATDKSVTWKSADEAIATVEEGVITAVSAGKTTVTVTTKDGGKTANCDVTVTENFVAVTGITLNYTTLPLSKDRQATLIPTFAPIDATNKKVNWQSTNEAVATVSDAGVVKAISMGKATITATTEDGGKTANCKVTVSGPTIIGEWVKTVSNNDVILRLKSDGLYDCLCGTQEHGRYSVNIEKNELTLIGYRTKTRQGEYPPRIVIYERSEDGSTLTIKSGNLNHFGNPSWLKLPITLNLQ